MTIITLIIPTKRTFTIKSNKPNKINNCPEIGVHQGNVLGPLLLNISDTNSKLNIHNINYHMYEYDIQLYTSTNLNDLPETIIKINKLTTELKIYFNYLLRLILAYN